MSRTRWVWLIYPLVLSVLSLYMLVDRMAPGRAVLFAILVLLMALCVRQALQLWSAGARWSAVLSLFGAMVGVIGIFLMFLRMLKPGM